MPPPCSACSATALRYLLRAIPHDGYGYRCRPPTGEGGHHQVEHPRLAGKWALAESPELLRERLARCHTRQLAWISHVASPHRAAGWHAAAASTTRGISH